MVSDRSCTKVLTRCEKHGPGYTSTMDSGFQFNRPPFFFNLRSVPMVCFTWLMAALCWAESPAALSEEENKAQQTSKPRTFDSRITMHEVDFGTDSFSGKETKPSLNQIFNQKARATPSFRGPQPAALPASSMPSSPLRSQKDPNKTRNWLTPKSNLDGLDLDDSEQNGREQTGLLEPDTGWGWLADSVLGSRQEEKQVQSASEDKGLDVYSQPDQEWSVDLKEAQNEREWLSQDGMQTLAIEPLREGGAEAGRALPQETYRPLFEGFSVKNISDLEKSTIYKKEESPKAERSEKQTEVRQWNSPFGRQDRASLPRIRQERVQPLDQTFSSSKTIGFSKGAQAARGISYPSGIHGPDFLTAEPNPQRGDKGLALPPFGSGLSSRSGSASGLNRPASSAGFGIPGRSSLQTPLQSYQPLEDQRP